jgi:beta-mannosidase
VLTTDEGLNGLGVHLVNDTDAVVRGRLVVELSTAQHRVEAAGSAVEVPSRGGIELSCDALFDGFRDLTYAYRFGPRPYELVTVRLVGEDGVILAETGFLPGGLSRSLEGDIGLQAALEQADERVWSLSVSSRRFAQFVCIEVPGHRPADSWFHLAPGATRSVALHRDGSEAMPPRGQVRALNSVTAASVSP